jgi:hypothetical protein
MRAAPASGGGAADPFVAWQDGLVSPSAITAALNMRALSGPEVDRDCGVQEPAVDQWEAAQLYPTWQQLEALARLTGFPVRFFTRRHDPDVEGGFICQRSGRGRGCQRIPARTGPTEYPRNVVAATPGIRWHAAPRASSENDMSPEEASVAGPDIEERK